MSIPTIDESALQQIRHYLHRNPEVSGNEKHTSEFILERLKSYGFKEVITRVGGYGLVATYDSGSEGKHVAIRGDIDALPINEENSFSHKSQNQGVSHKCGHDGHTTILLGLAYLLIKQPIKKGKVSLVFQPAEETGEGAKAMLEDKKLKDFNPDFIFGLHNIPGYEYGTIILKKNHFAAASRGMIIQLKGHTSHAAEPEKGNSPIKGIQEIIQMLNDLNHVDGRGDDFKMITTVYIKMGDLDFGITPRLATYALTLRTYTNAGMYQLTEDIESGLRKITDRTKLKYSVSYCEDFPALRNDDNALQKVRNAADKLGLHTQQRERPMPWSEDFSQFSLKFNSAFFGLGAGNDTPQLHADTYDWPDNITKYGVQIFFKLIQECLE
ncbi:MAG: amidohydrolase [Cyclobacteriaceae bacterium]|nr:amidohydrolase [Cyclobacteriaceae bacterium]MCH8514888.1 amidohydrolase [Cyclobacteriaceae bacterium]